MNAMVEKIEQKLQGIDESMPAMGQLYALEDAIKSSGLPIIELDVENFHGDGLYGRQLFIPKHTLAVGKVHRHRHITVLLGDVSLLTSNGMKRMQGWHVVVDEPGIKRAAFAHEDTVILTVHATDKTSISDIEREVIIPKNQVLEDLLQEKTS